jgi:hypothetical protein
MPRALEDLAVRGWRVFAPPSAPHRHSPARKNPAAAGPITWTLLLSVYLKARGRRRTQPRRGGAAAARVALAGRGRGARSARRAPRRLGEASQRHHAAAARALPQATHACRRRRRRRRRAGGQPARRGRRLRVHATRGHVRGAGRAVCRHGRRRLGAVACRVWRCGLGSGCERATKRLLHLSGRHVRRQRQSDRAVRAPRAARGAAWREAAASAAAAAARLYCVCGGVACSAAPCRRRPTRAPPDARAARPRPTRAARCAARC